MADAKAPVDAAGGRGRGDGESSTGAAESSDTSRGASNGLLGMMTRATPSHQANPIPLQTSPSHAALVDPARTSEEEGAIG